VGTGGEQAAGERTGSGRRLVLLRHAKSDWPGGVPDHERPLARRGRRDAPAVGRWLEDSGCVPDAVICSTALRARETWELASALPGLAAVPVRPEPRVYEATALGLLMLVREFEPRWRTVAVVGHNPGLAELTIGLAGPDGRDPPPAFPTAFAAVLELPGDWAEAEPDAGRLLAFSVPADRRDAERGS
jgi:phosphohistidine phosphatase